MTGQFPPAWFPDPTGRFEHRYWDGERWTEHVGTQGRQAIDHLQPPPPLSGGQPVQPVTAQSAPVNKRIARQAEQVANAPLGGGTLLTERILVVNQKLKKFGSRLGYGVFDQRGRQLAAIQEVRRDLGTKLGDHMRGRSDRTRTYRFRVIDMSGQLLLTMIRPDSSTTRSRMVIEGPGGHQIGQIIRQRSPIGLGTAGAAAGAHLLAPVVKRQLGGVVGTAAGVAASGASRMLSSKSNEKRRRHGVTFALESRGQYIGEIWGERASAWEFSVLDASGAEVARITKTFAGIVKENFTQADNYVVQMHEELEEPMRSLVIGASLALDVAFNQN